MKKIVVGIIAAAAFAIFSFGSFAQCNKSVQSGKPCAASRQMQTKCGAHATACCDKCAKDNCRKSADGKQCCQKCTCGEGCAAKGGKGCVMKNVTGCVMKAGKCPDDCSCKNCQCKSRTADQAAKESAPDPVCGMDVATKDAAHTYEYKGKTYYFCSESCKERFSKDPARFLEK